MANIRITHQTIYRHGGPASLAWQMMQLQPRQEPAQDCLEFRLEISPPTHDLTSRTDAFGNIRHFFSIRETHRELSITSHSLVQRQPISFPLPGISQPVQATKNLITDLIRNRNQFELEQYLHPTDRVPFLPAAAELAATLSPETTALIDWIDQLGRIFADTFTFDPTATDVGSTLAELMQTKRGVCQDFTHLFLSCARQHGLPAAYVSGYLMTNPPPGQERLQGADAMHAWVSIFVPEIGWVDYDPTNHCFVGAGHIVVARGRDYTDVSPTRGVFQGGGGQTLSIAVTVEPMEAKTEAETSVSD